MRKGVANLARHVENTKKFGVPVVVAVNVFPTDTEAEHEVIREAALAAGADDCVRCTHHAEGGAGAAELGAAVVRSVRETRTPPTSSCRTSTRPPSRKKSPPSPRNCTAPRTCRTARRRRKKSRSSPRRGSITCPSAWRRRSILFSHDADAKGAPEDPPAYRRMETQRRREFPSPLVGAFPTIPRVCPRDRRIAEDRHGPETEQILGPVVSASEGREPHSPWRRGRASGGGGGGGKRSGAVVSRGWKRRLLARRGTRRAIRTCGCEIRYAIVHVLQHVFVFVTHSAAAARPPALIAASIALPRSRCFADLCFFPSQCAS